MTETEQAIIDAAKELFDATFSRDMAEQFEHGDKEACEERRFEAQEALFRAVRTYEYGESQAAGKKRRNTKEKHP